MRCCSCLSVENEGREGRLRRIRGGEGRSMTGVKGGNSRVRQKVGRNRKK